MISLSPKSMLRIAGIGLGTTALGAAAWGWKKSGEDPTVTDTQDRLGYTASAVGVGVPLVGATAAGGIVAGGMLKAYGSTARGAATFKGMKASMKAVRKNALNYKYMSGKVKGAAGSIGYMSGVSKGMKGPLTGLMLLGGAVAALGYNLAEEDQPATAAYGTPDGAGGTEYSQSPTRDRMNAMNASGDMVFGLNNLRHG